MKKIHLFRWAILFAVSLLAFGCQNPSSPWEPTAPYIVVLGDSIAYGTSEIGGEHTIKNPDGSELKPWESLPGMPAWYIHQATGLQVVNLAVGGSFTSSARAVWTDAILKYHTLPKLVYIHTGVNNVRNAGDITAMMDDYGFFRASAEEHGIRIIIDNVGPCTAPCFNSANFAADCQSINTLLSTFGRVQVLDYHAWATGAGFSTNAWRAGTSDDGLHPNYEVNADYCNAILIPAVLTYL